MTPQDKMGPGSAGGPPAGAPPPSAPPSPDQGAQPVPPTIVKQISDIRRMIQDLARAYPDFSEAADQAIQALVNGMVKVTTQQPPQEGNAPMFGM